ncbi:hypothetical protein [Bifidobacterium eulemuris]|uniref:Uncharacterized protein n=1 Tax=Bifidobacterium eulemuris TaxID=1765219 RepID=A0A261GAE5_9BIFI|nr:hypothetical protein [Bifidobacterium eulemuris]OZG68213.1 hypothetical protein BEUL_1226 [Bifidobacterium eulemuris]QOL31730.1 hypothetical protein BE0216_04060 [Bifidobacterium eulemuris]
MNETYPDNVRVIDLTGPEDTRSRSEILAELAAGTAIERRAKELNKANKEKLADMLDPGETVNAMIGNKVGAKVTLTRGSAGGGYKVKDEMAYGVWLANHGRENDVYAVPMPTEPAKKKGYIDSLVQENGGELPDGVELYTGSLPTVKVTMDKQVEAEMWERSELPEANVLLTAGGEL